MTKYYSQISRCIERRSRLLGFDNFKAFYAIAAMNNWQDVVVEQKGLCDLVGINPCCSLLGTDTDKKWVESLGLTIEYYSNDLQEYETPALNMFNDWSCQNPTSAVLYFHTKGVSVPSDNIKKYWRWLMMDYVIAEYQINLKKLELCDILGVNWMELHDYPHFCGNFWMARCDWIRTLDNPWVYRQRGGPKFWQHPWERMSAEMWIGSKGYHVVESLCSKNAKLWEDNIHYQKYKNKEKYENQKE